jgi:hypothetical protein
MAAHIADGPSWVASASCLSDPITAAFVEAICHHTMATPAHIRSRLAPNRDD